jgi:hypothetical protein
MHRVCCNGESILPLVHYYHHDSAIFARFRYSLESRVLAGDLLEAIALHALENKQPFKAVTLEKRHS